MESLSLILSCSPPLQNHLKTQKPVTSGPISLPQNSTSTSIVASQPFNSSQLHFPSTKNNLQPQSSKSFVLVIDAFRKLRDDPNVQLLDIRDEKSLKYLKSPNLKILNKATVQVPFSEDDEDGFVKKVLERFGNPADTALCVLGNFDGISIKVAELLFKNGFKEAYAIKGGVGGTKGWLESQETLLPPSLHIYPKKKVETSQKTGMNGGVVRGNEDSNGAASAGSLP
ncbi:rhodanese-like domain-containing protein 4A chloroplastic [Prunus yedoensis var. nudiflora]|uniref:Rhodanese-like domain-containing protein 4A chloroplastic n=1 Tax=Prunus yedoensis var. nudiflora TaxID=2094558 RepID=A0A314U7Y1_PRUYE|nr:rhodanese-like domain-containing protein 4A chloroplastic [Prunus yedoensis var. nudiflora]